MPDRSRLGDRMVPELPRMGPWCFVRRIFELSDAGVGFRSIAQKLEADGIPSPGETGLLRHPRSAGVWGGSAVRAILVNPRYLGHQVAGRQRRHDELLDAHDPALGTVSRQHWQDREAWAWSEELAWPALVPVELWERVNKRIKNTYGSARRRPRAQPGKYLLTGLLRCGHCGKAMFGNTAKGKAYYRCAATRPDYATPAVPGHPPTYMVREERVLSALDQWLGTLTEPDRIDSTVAAILGADEKTSPEPAVVNQAHQRERRLQAELERVLAALRAGMDPALAAGETRKIQADILAARSVIDDWGRSCEHPALLAEADVRAVLSEAGGLIGLLGEADRAERASLYQALGLSLRYEKEAPTGRELVRARLELTRGGGTIYALAPTGAVTSEAVLVLQ